MKVAWNLVPVIRMVPLLEGGAGRETTVPSIRGATSGGRGSNQSETDSMMMGLRSWKGDEWGMEGTVKRTVAAVLNRFGVERGDLKRKKSPELDEMR
jgi:hypothetical protein